MAQVDDATVDKKVRVELKAIDINDTSLPEGKQQQINPEADAWEQAAPPPDGTYEFKLFFAQQGFQLGKTDDGDVYYVSNLQCKIQSDDPKLKDRTTFAKVSTFISAGKEISTMAGMIRKFGVNVPTTIAPLELCKLFRKCISKEPKLYSAGEWKAWDMEEEAWILVGQSKFPKLPDGGHNHVVRSKKGEQVTAKWKHNRWYGLKEYRAMLAKEEEDRKKAAAGRAPTSARQEVVGDLGGEFTEVQAQAPRTAAPAAAPKPVDDDFVLDE